ncbi:MAG: GSCFA domain-containing protein [Rhodospirillaceae bacterium]
MKRIEFPQVGNFMWSKYFNEHLFTIKPKALIGAEDRVFTIGSCFAEEVRKALSNQNVKCLPEFEQVKTDPSRYLIDTLPNRPHMNYYNTYTIHQEFERCAGLWKQSDEDIWEIQDNWWGQETCFQDPYRRSLFGKSKNDLLDAIELSNLTITNGFNSATAFFITLGLIEVWRKKDNGRFSCQEPGYERGGGAEQTEFYLSSFEDNKDNLKAVVDIIRDRKGKNVPIVLTVSPVPLALTWSGKDIYTANTLSKAVLRAVAGEVSSLYQNVTYFPSYEIVQILGAGAFQEKDGRHVKPEAVEIIMQAFLKAHMKQ